MSFSVKIKRITAGMAAMGLAIALSAGGAAAQVTALTGWVSGTTNAKVSGSNRLMVVMAMGEHPTADFSATGATYGGQTMTKQAEKMWANGGRTYATIFTLNEAGVNAASSGTIAVTWSSNPSNGNNIYSVLLGNVDQAAPIGATSTNALDGTTVTTSALTAASGDMIIFDGGTGSNNTITFNNGFTKGFESNANWGDGVGAYKMGTGVSETPQYTQSASNRMVICAMVVKKSSGTTTYYTLTMANDGHGTTTPTGATSVAAGVATPITATPSANYAFKGWDVTSGTATIANANVPSTTVTLSSGNATVTASFTSAPTNYTLTPVVVPAGSGSITLNPAGGTYASGTIVSITASATGGYSFSNWSGDASGTTTTSTVTMTGNKSVTANFAAAPTNYTLTPVVVPAGSGSITLNPAGGTYANGTIVTVTASATGGYSFSSWSGNASGTSPTSTVTMTANKSVTANFAAAPTNYALTPVVVPAGSGSITLNPAGGTYASGTIVSLTASATGGYSFSSWSGNASGTSPTSTVTMTANKSVTANFALKTYQLTVNAGTGGTRTAPSTSPVTVTHGVATTITASANTGYSFVDWTVTSGTANIANPALASTTVTLTSGNATVLANFAVSSGPKYPAQVTGPGQDMMVDGNINCNGTFYGQNFYLDGDAHIGNAEIGNYISVHTNPEAMVEISAGNYATQINLNPTIAPGSIEMKCNSLIVRDAPIECSSVKIGTWTLTTPDYVFEKGYKLRDLSEVERHIAANKHLPDVPSASEMKNGGVDLAQLNMTLLKKVEELTLYAIEQNKRAEAQNKRIEALEGEVKGLKRTK